MLILKDEMQDSFKIDGKMGDEKQKITGFRSLHGKLRRGPEEHSHCDEMAGWRNWT